jgi:4-hydroxy-tetrahydrodipicolinate synthase
MFKGSLVALITPFDRKGRLDIEQLEQLVLWHIAQGTDGIVCAATTGEGVALSDSEKRRVVQVCVNAAAGRVPVIAATGVSGTAQTVRNTAVAQRLGADGCLVVTPFYNRPSQRGMVEHFKEVAKVGLPVIVYHNPARAAVRLTLETVAEIAPVVAGLKDSGGDLEWMGKAAKLLPVLAGDDDVTVDAIRVGAVGCIGVTPNVMPKAWKQMIALAMNGKWNAAEGRMKRFLPLIKALFTETNPQGPKFAVSLLGRCEPVLRLPMMLPEEKNQEKIRREMVLAALPWVGSTVKSSN